MLIQNASNATQAPQPARPVSDTSGSSANSAPVSAPVANTTANATPVIESPKTVAPAPSDTQLKKSLDNINTLLLKSNISIQFVVDPANPKPVVKLMDSQTGEVIRQYPTDAAMAISNSMDRIQQGLLLSQKA